MAKMKKLQPEMEKIRDRYKDDRARQQQELMALYKNEKINPMAGCLPIVLQIPVFFALYKVLFVTIDMRHAPFFGWIHDLSAPDPTSLFNLFGLIPFAPPDYLHVGAWPIIMGMTMWVQMQLNPQQPDPVQQKIFNWMPVIFTFMLASFPSGLVIYWAWNNVLSLLQQYTIMRRNNTEVHLWKNLGTDKWKARFAAARNMDVGALKNRVGSASAQVLGKVIKPKPQPASGGSESWREQVDDPRAGAAHAWPEARRERERDRCRPRSAGEGRPEGPQRIRPRHCRQDRRGARDPARQGKLVGVIPEFALRISGTQGQLTGSRAAHWVPALRAAALRPG